MRGCKMDRWIASELRHTRARARVTPFGERRKPVGERAKRAAAATAASHQSSRFERGSRLKKAAKLIWRGGEIKQSAERVRRTDFVCRHQRTSQTNYTWNRSRRRDQPSTIYHCILVPCQEVNRAQTNHTDTRLPKKTNFFHQLFLATCRTSYRLTIQSTTFLFYVLLLFRLSFFHSQNKSCSFNWQTVQQIQVFQNPSSPQNCSLFKFLNTQHLKSFQVLELQF